MRFLQTGPQARFENVEKSWCHIATPFIGGGRKGKGLREGVYALLVWNTMCCVCPPCTWPKNITCPESEVGRGSTSLIQTSAGRVVPAPFSPQFSASLCFISMQLACFSSLKSIAGRICWNTRQKILHLWMCRHQKLSEKVQQGGKGELVGQNSEVRESPTFSFSSHPSIS